MTRESNEIGAWAGISDVFRWWVLLNHGGIYFDTDVEVLKPLDDLLDNDFFVGFANLRGIPEPGGGVGAAKGHYLIKKIVDYYNTKTIVDFPVEDQVDILFTKEYGFLNNGKYQSKNGITLYPAEYFNILKDGRINIEEGSVTENTYSIHLKEGAWMTEDGKKECILISKSTVKYGTRLGTIIYALGAIFTLRRSGIQKVFGRMENDGRKLKKGVSGVKFHVKK